MYIDISLRAGLGGEGETEATDGNRKRRRGRQDPTQRTVMFLYHQILIFTFGKKFAVNSFKQIFGLLLLVIYRYLTLTAADVWRRIRRVAQG